MATDGANVQFQHDDTKTRRHEDDSMNSVWTCEDAYRSIILFLFLLRAVAPSCFRVGIQMLQRNQWLTGITHTAARPNATAFDFYSATTAGLMGPSAGLTRYSLTRSSTICSSPRCVTA